MDVAADRNGEVSIVTDHYIAGRLQTGTGAGIAVHNPFDNSELCRLAPAGADQVDAAIDAAHRAFKAPAWQRLTGRERGALLNRLAGLLRRDLEAFATLESLNTGIPIRETRMEVATSANHLEYFAALAV